MKSRRKTIAVDFDNTIMDTDENGTYSLISGAREAMHQLKEAGYEIVINTCRVGLAKEQKTLSRELKFIESFLIKNNVPYDSIHLGTKLVADAYIDDRAVAFGGDWSETLKQTQHLLKDPKSRDE